jgi:hypothetical protein
MPTGGQMSANTLRSYGVDAAFTQFWLHERGIHALKVWW